MATLDSFLPEVIFAGCCAENSQKFSFQAAEMSFQLFRSVVVTGSDLLYQVQILAAICQETFECPPELDFIQKSWSLEG